MNPSKHCFTAINPFVPAQQEIIDEAQMDAKELLAYWG